MFLGALVDSGLPLQDLVKSLKALKLNGYHLTAKNVKRSSLSAMKVDVVIQKGFRKPLSLSRIKTIISSSRLPKEVQGLGLEVFEQLARAEGRVHRMRYDKVQFHEVGVIDSLVDIMGSLMGLHLLGVTNISASAVNVGAGSIASSHGVLPVPGPAVAALAKGIPIYSQGPSIEMTTPTGMALVRTLVGEFGILPPMRTKTIGYGAGTNNPKGWPNVVRLMFGDAHASVPYQQDRVSLVETNIDDLNPQAYEQVLERLFRVGALDVTMTPVVMKRGRPGIILQVLVPSEKREAAATVLLSDTTALGLRVQEVDRWILPRRVHKVSVPGGTIRMKIGKLAGGKEKVAPEYRDCLDIANKTDRSVSDVMAEALKRYTRTTTPNKSTARSPRRKR